jgi:hypothetical protein
MEARILRAAVLTAVLASFGANHRTANFVVNAPTDAFARTVAEMAEQYRRDLAVEWLGRELPRWPQPCPIRVRPGRNLGAGGATSFAFHNGQPFGWDMSIQGTPQRILDSVLPHEITHTIFATHFGRPLPRWADEGACTTVEHVSERQRQHDLLLHFLTHGRGIAFRQMFAMREYPSDILPLYAQGYSLARYLIAQGGRRKFVQYVADGMNSGNWTEATRQHYGFQGLDELQVTWNDWVRQGSCAEDAQAMLAVRMGGGEGNPRPLRGQPVVRAQNEDGRGLLPRPFVGRRGQRAAAEVMPVSWTNHSFPDRRTASNLDSGVASGNRSWYASRRTAAAGSALR